MAFAIVFMGIIVLCWIVLAIAMAITAHKEKKAYNNRVCPNCEGCVPLEPIEIDPEYNTNYRCPKCGYTVCVTYYMIDHADEI